MAVHITSPMRPIMYRLLASLLGILLIAGCSDSPTPASTSAASMVPMASSAPTSTQDAIQDGPAAVADPERQQRIKENLEYQLREQLRGAPLVVSEIKLDVAEGLDGGVVTIGGQQTIPFVTTRDDKHFFLVAAGPLDVSQTSEERAAAEAEAERVAARIAEQRAGELIKAAEKVPTKGPADAPVLVVEFSDFQCPFCKQATSVVNQILEKYPDEVRFAYMNFPLNIHPWAMPAAVTASCTAALDDDAFWALHDAYFEHQDDLTTENVLMRSREFVSGTGIDMQAWSECVDNDQSESHLAAVASVQEAMFLGNAYGLTGTPGFFVNGRFVRGAPPVDEFSAIIEEALAN